MSKIKTPSNPSNRKTYETIASHTEDDDMELCLRILLVEDSEIDVRITERALSNHFPHLFELVRVGTIEDAYRILEEKIFQIDVVLLDLGLPDAAYPGESYHRLSVFRDDIPFIVLTSVEDQGLAETILGIGAQDYVYKNSISVQPSYLTHAIEFALIRHKKFSGKKQRLMHDLGDVDETLSMVTGGYSVSSV